MRQYVRKNCYKVFERKNDYDTQISYQAKKFTKKSKDPNPDDQIDGLPKDFEGKPDFDRLLDSDPNDSDHSSQLYGDDSEADVDPEFLKKFKEQWPYDKDGKCKDPDPIMTAKDLKNLKNVIRDFERFDRLVDGMCDLREEIVADKDY